MKKMKKCKIDNCLKKYLIFPELKLLTQTFNRHIDSIVLHHFLQRMQEQLFQQKRNYKFRERVILEHEKTKFII